MTRSAVEAFARAPRAPDLRLVPAAVASWAAAGWAVGVPVVAVTASGVVAALVAVLVLARGRRRGSGSAAVVLGCVAAVLLVTAGHLLVRGAGLLPELVADGATATVTGAVLTDSRLVRTDDASRAERYTVRLDVRHVAGRGRTGAADATVLVIGSPQWDGLATGDRVAATGRLVAAEPGGDVVALLVASRPPRTTGPVPGWLRAAESLRAGLREAAAPLPPDAGGLLPGLVVGDTSRLPPDLEEAMRRTGLTHLTAVSGANVAIVCGAVLVVATGCGARRGLRLALAGAALGAFVVLARPEPSVLRAAVMGAIGLVGLASARRGRGVPLLACAVVVLCVVDPWLSRSFGFALSVLATAALLLLARPMAEVMARWVPRLVAQAVAVPAAAQAVCGPVVVLLTPQVPLLAVPANLAVAPAVAPATVLGVVATVVAPVWMPGARAVAWLGGLATGWIAWVARRAADLPGATVPWPGGVRGAALLAAVTVVALAAVARVARRGPGRGPARAARHRASPGRASPRGPALLAAVVVACLLLVGTATVVRSRAGAWPPTGWRVVACDVGQGDALVVRSGPGAAVVVDAGPDPGPVDRCLRRLDVRRVDLLVLSHFHADHVRGLAGVLDGRAVETVLVSPLAEPRTQTAWATSLLEEQRLTAVPAWSGAAGAAGDVAWRVVWPSRLLEAGGEEGDAANDASVALLLEVDGLRVLAAGDLEPAGQSALRREQEAAPGGPLWPVDVLKVAHHGSAAQDADLTRRLAPRVALVSAGERNDYGHPTRSALDLLASTGATVLRTDVHGDVAVGGAGERLWVAPTRSSPPPGRLGAWQREDGQHRSAPAARARPPRRPGGTSHRTRSCSSPAPRSCSPIAPSSGSAASPGRTAPTSRSSRSRPRCTSADSSTRGRAPPSSVSRASSWPRGSSRPRSPSSRTSSPTWTTFSRTSSWCCGTAAASAAGSCSTPRARAPARWRSTAHR